MPYKDIIERQLSQAHYRQRKKLKSFTLEDGTKVIPMRYQCVECGEVYEEGFIHADVYPIQQGWLCAKCQATMPHTITVDETAHTKVVKINYSPKRYHFVTGECALCRAFPCKHVYQDGFEWKVKKEEVKKK